MWKRVLYISGPLRAPADAEHGRYTPSVIHENTERAWNYAAIAWRAGWAVICPHANTRDMDGIGVPANAFIVGDSSFLERMRPGQDLVLMLPGWRESEGSILEHDYARKLCLTVLEASASGPMGELLHKLSVAYKVGITGGDGT